ncbi:uncharacterized protein V1516DRAFT_616051, partial [Lipomyces oligophaga]|uniref:uncharacterized protein n=1 Tax=Lipomyces oligophaga TaxID=45792 RepID=UPI0034CE116A
EDDEFGDFGEMQSALPSTPAPVPVSVSRFQTTVRPSNQSEPLRILTLDDFASPETLEEATNIIADKIYPGVRMLTATRSGAEDLPPIRMGTSVRTTRHGSEFWTELNQKRTPHETDWRTSRIRRAYLINLGLPVDLDQILPSAGKQEKLVVLSGVSGARRKLGQESTGSLLKESGRESTEQTPGSPLKKLAHTASAPVSRVSSPAIDFDLNYARRLSRTSSIVLDRMTVQDLQSHIAELERIKIEAATYLGYWIDLRQNAEDDKEKYEGVIASSIDYAERLRKHTTDKAFLPRKTSLLRSKSLQK